MKVPSFLRIKRTRSLQSPSVLSSDSSSSSSELSSPAGRGKEGSLERKALPMLPKSSSSSSFTSWMWRQSKRSMSGELLGKAPRNDRSELCAAAPSFDGTSELADVFGYFDKNGVGKISSVDLGLVLCSLGIEYTDDELEIMVKEVDADGDGFIDLEEFINLNKLASKATGGNEGSSEEVLRDAFHLFDVEKKGYISADALHRILSGLGDECITLEECRRMINSVDQDGDGRVDFNDFQLMMRGNLVC